MTPAQFNEWLAAMGCSGAEASRQLRIGKNTISKYRQEGAPYVVALACRALYQRLGPWPAKG